MWPRPLKTKKKLFSCEHCSRKFRTRQALGGHTSKIHPGSSERFKRMIVRREQRANDRHVHRLAKEIYVGLKLNTLDAKTYKTFKWQRNRLSNHELA